MLPRLVLLATLAALVLAQGASAATYRLGTFKQTPGAVGTTASVAGTSAEVTAAMRLVAKRNGAVVLDTQGTFFSRRGSASSSVSTGFDPQRGDVFELYNPGSSPTPAKTFNFSGRPTVDSCPVGQNRVSGKLDPGVTVTGLGRRPSLRSGDPNRTNVGTTTVAGDTYTVTFGRPLAAGDLVVVSSSQTTGDFIVTRSRTLNAGACVVEEPPPPLNGLLEQLRASDVEQGSDPTLITILVRCSARSTIPCAGTASAVTVQSFAAQRRRKRKQTLGTKKFTVAPGKSKTVRIKIGRKGQRLLRRQRRLRVKITVTTKDSANKVLRVSRTITIRTKRRRR